MMLILLNNFNLFLIQYFLFIVCHSFSLFIHLFFKNLKIKDEKKLNTLNFGLYGKNF